MSVHQIFPLICSSLRLSAGPALIGAVDGGKKGGSDGGRENGAAAAANKGIRRRRSPGRLLESSSGGSSLSSPFTHLRPRAFCTLLQGITTYPSAFSCFFLPPFEISTCRSGASVLKRLENGRGRCQAPLQRETAPLVPHH